MFSNTSGRAALVAAALALLLSPSAGGSTRHIDLGKKPPDMTLTGAYKVAGGGDVNGDGVDDILVSKGAFWQPPTNGVVYVVFGDPSRSNIDLEDLNTGDGGFVIHGSKPEDGASVADIAGDVNGDGLDDVIVGAEEADNNGRFESGSAYIVFGKTNTAPVFLAQFDANAQGPLGYRIDGPSSRAFAGAAVSGAGDINQDGLDDVVIGASFAGAYVVFGQSGFLPIDLRRFNSGSQGDSGFMIKTPLPNWTDFYDVAGGGDVNGDGVSDVVVSLYKGNRAQRGAFVVFGKDSAKLVDVRKLGGRGFRIYSYAGGYTVDDLGDVNRDGLDDIGFWGGDHSYVVFGKKSRKTIEVHHLGDRGYKINTNPEVRVGYRLSSIGDVNGDRRPELLLGSSDSNFHGRTNSGSTYVVFGQKRSTTVRLGNLGRRGYRIDGPSPNLGSGGSVASTGDINGDGRDEILIGAPGIYDDPGRAFVVWGRP